MNVQYSYFLLCSVCLELYINFTLGLFYTKRQHNGEKWKECHAVIAIQVVYNVCMISPDRC
jgi:hypothetical protein